MAISRTGAFFEDNTSYIFGFSDSGGRLEVSDGHVLSLTSVTSGPFLSAARPGSGMPNPDALGEIIIRDPGSLIEVISAGSSSEGASLGVAFGEDTRGVMQVLDGAQFRVTDPTGADNSYLTGGGEAGWIGRGPRADGTLEIRAAEFLLAGTGSNLSVGRDGGTGAVHVTQGADFHMETTSAGAADFTHLRVGIDDGTGLMEIDQSFALVQTGLNANGAVDIGRNGGTGTLNISGSGEEPYREGLFLVGNAFSPSVEMRVGYQNGFGNLSMDGGTLAIANSGVEVLRDGGSQRWPGEGEMGGSAALFVGQEGGTGEFTAANTAQIFVGARTDAAAHVGVGDGADGTMSLDGSSMRVVSFDANAGLQVGEWEGGDSTGTMLLRNAADVVIEAQDAAYANIGRWAGSDGTLSIMTGSTIALNSETNGADVIVGWNGGTGKLQMSDAGSRIDIDAARAGLWVGVEGGIGTFTAGPGSTVEQIARSEAAQLGIGVGGGTGQVTLDAATMLTRSLADEVSLMIGEWQAGGADGSLVLRNSAFASFEGESGVFANIGRHAGNTGRLQVETGSTLELSVPQGEQSNLHLGRENGTGTASVSGAGSEVRLSGNLGIGHSGGTGTLALSDGGAVVNERGGFASTYIGRGANSDGEVSFSTGNLTTRSLTGDGRLDVGEDGGTGTVSGTAALLRTEAWRHADLLIGEGVGADGSVVLQGESALDVISHAQSANLDIGNRGGTGSLTLTDSSLQLAAPMRDAGGDAMGNTFAWVLVGTEGGTGNLVFDNAQADIAAGQGAGFRVGTRWTDTVDNSGTGSITLQNSAQVYAEALLEDTNFWIGGGAGSNATARILSGSVLDASGNGRVQVGYAEIDMLGGGEGSLDVDGAGSLLTGVRSLTAGGNGSDGIVRISDGARALIGGLDADSNVGVDFGWRDGSRGELIVTNALFSVQAGVGENADQPFLGAGVAFGQEGGTGVATITGARETDPAAAHGLIVLGNAASDYAEISIGRDAGSVGNVTIRGAFFGAQNDGTTFVTDGLINLDGDGGYGAVRIGIDGGTGSLDIGAQSTLFAIAGSAEDSAEVKVGSGAGGSGSLLVSDGTQVNIISRQSDAWLMVGQDGGASGTVTISDSSVLIDGARNGGIRLGTSWFDTPDQVGIGRLAIEDGSDVTIRAGGNQAMLQIGGGLGSDAQASIRDASLLMEGDAHRLVIVGGTPAFLPGTGGEGQLLLEGASARLNGARDILVGTNGGTGRLDLRAGAQIMLEDAGGGVEGRTVLGVGIGRVRADEDNTSADGQLTLQGASTFIDVTAQDRALLFVGSGGGLGHATVSDGAKIVMEGAIAALEIGVNGGTGWMDVQGAGSAVTLGGSDARIHIGRERDANAASETAGQGILRIGSGAEVSAATKVEIGDDSANMGALVMAGGRLLTPLVELHAGATPLDNMLLGWGEITGVAGQPALLMAGSSFFIGDLMDAEGTKTTATGLMQITGNVVNQDSAIYFDIGSQGGGYDQIEVTGSFAMDGGTLQISALSDAPELLAHGGIRLLSASEGIFLNNVALEIEALPDGTVIQTELRNSNTELWAYVGMPGAPVDNVDLPPMWRDWLDWIGGGGGAAPPAPETGRGDVIADPHLVTLDGLAYSFHAAGEFVLTREIGGGLEVQARMAPVAANASENVAAAVRLAGGVVMLDAANPDSALANGTELRLKPGESAAFGGDLIYRTGDTWHLVYRHGDPDGDRISAVSVTIVDDRLDIAVFADQSLAGQIEGLLGNFDGNPETDLALRDGRLVARPLRFGDDPETGELGLYGAFRDEWRISEAVDSLFTYRAGEGPDSFYLPDYPARMLTLEDFDDDARDQVAAQLTQAGLQEGTPAYNNALFDLLATGNPSYLDAAIGFQEQQEVRPESAAPVIAPPVIGGALENLVGLSGTVQAASGDALSGVQVNFTPQGRSVSHIRNAGSEGAFLFELLPETAGALSASLEYDSAVHGSVTALDALNVLRLAVGLAPSWGTASALNFIAADINQDGSVTALDALEVLRVAVGLNSANQPRWVFLDAQTDLSDIDRGNVAVDLGARIGPLSADGITDISMTGVLLGNMQEFA